MKTAILTIALALASALSALAQTVMRENSTVYFKTNVFLHDDPTNALHTRISVAYGWGDHAEAGYLTSYWTNNIDAGDVEIYNLNQLGVGLITGQGGTGRIISPYDGEFRGAWNFVTDELTVNGLIVHGGATNSFIRPDGGTNTISFDETGNMIVAVDGAAAMTISTNGNVGIGISGGRLEADEIKADKIVLATVGQQGFEAWLRSDGTNLFFVSTVPPGFTNALTANAP